MHSGRLPHPNTLWMKKSWSDLGRFLDLIVAVVATGTVIDIDTAQSPAPELLHFVFSPFRNIFVFIEASRQYNTFHQNLEARWLIA